MRVSDLEQTNATSLRSSLIASQTCRFNSSFMNDKVPFIKGRCKKAKKIRIVPSKDFKENYDPLQASVNSARMSRVIDLNDSMEKKSKPTIKPILKQQNAMLSGVLECQKKTAAEKLSKLQAKNNELQSRLDKSQLQMMMNTEELSKTKKEVEDLVNILEERAGKLKYLKDLVKTLKASVKAKKHSLSKYNKDLILQKERIHLKEQTMREYAKELTKLKKTLDVKSMNISKEELVCKEMAKSIREKEHSLSNALISLENRLVKIEKRKERLKEREAKLSNLEQENTDLNTLVAEMYEDLWVKKKEMQSKELMQLFNRVQSKQKEIDERKKFVLSNA
eukprot:TRINITY_DN11504_c0_g1_i6.p1 TRINITY_DN11504_c0_g1~~TRINITY_DN11504_c0_g1_i6.p1  ORF type:complete len:336 (-),score=74.03 TRINITY_DN11504_c0_g1_i6:86-1093(-)